MLVCIPKASVAAAGILLALYGCGDDSPTVLAPSSTRAEFPLPSTVPTPTTTSDTAVPSTLGDPSCQAFSPPSEVFLAGTPDIDRNGVQDIVSAYPGDEWVVVQPLVDDSYWPPTHLVSMPAELWTEVVVADAVSNGDGTVSVRFEAGGRTVTVTYDGCHGRITSAAPPG